MSTSTTTVRPLKVDPPASATVNRTQGDHWLDSKPKGFKNPWPSARPFPGWGVMYNEFLKKMPSQMWAHDPDRENFSNLVKQVKPDYGANLPPAQVKATWLGHASFLVEMPNMGNGADRGVRVLFDPAYSDRCSPLSFVGSLRYSELSIAPPATATELPEVDAIAISHNHYDHCDLNTLKELYTKHAERPPILFVGLKGAAGLRGTVGKQTEIVEMDWWEDRILSVEGKGDIKVTCTPSQHNCARTPFDRDQTLWASWALHSVDKDGKETGASAWHAGDTGYCAVDGETHTIDPALPVCPAFTEIGKKLGPFSVGMIPIGAYSPRAIMSTVHNAPIDAVRMFKDTQCKKAIAMHWGTWKMAFDPIAEPPKLLEEARKVVGLKEEEFGIVALGETRAYEA